MWKLLLYAILSWSLIACAKVNTENNAQAANYNMELGLSYLQQGDVATAKHKLLLAQQQAPTNVKVQNALAYFFERTGEKEQAENYYLQALNLAPKSGMVQNNYGTFLCRKGQYQAAIQHFILATQDANYLHPAQAYENAAICALKIPDKIAATDFFNKALTHNPARAITLQKLIKLKQLNA